jgi:hypothetical protein
MLSLFLMSVLVGFLQFFVDTIPSLMEEGAW